ncbi:MAG: hypothetical protein JNJ57_11555 [Saprospiraceae bacterium]|nr:hypothetical protein [Saprospiraceae bacterium]
MFAIRYIGLLSLFMLVAPEVYSQHYYYGPSTISMHALKGKHDATASFSISRSSLIQGWEFQGSYAVNRFLAVMVNYMNAGEKEVLKNQTSGAKLRCGELGIGVYEPLHKGSAHLFGGYSRGNMYNYYSGEEASDFTLSKIFLQSSMVYDDKYFRGGVGIRLSYLIYEKGVVPIAIPEFELDAITLLEEKSPLFLPEFGLNAGVKLSPVYLGVGMTAIYRQTDGLNFARLNSSIQLAVELGSLFKKRK